MGDISEVAGKKAIVVQGHAKSVGLANLVAAIDDTFTSWIDISTGRSLRFAVDEFETNSKTNVEHTVIDLAGRANDTLPIQFRLNDGPPSDEPQKVSKKDVWDYNAFLVALRSAMMNDSPTRPPSANPGTKNTSIVVGSPSSKALSNVRSSTVPAKASVSPKCVSPSVRSTRPMHAVSVASVETGPDAGASTSASVPSRRRTSTSAEAPAPLFIAA